MKAVTFETTNERTRYYLANDNDIPRTEGTFYEK